MIGRYLALWLSDKPAYNKTKSIFCESVSDFGHQRWLALAALAS
jgi:hypothetical protein